MSGKSPQTNVIPAVRLWAAVMVLAAGAYVSGVRAGSSTSPLPALAGTPVSHTDARHRKEGPQRLLASGQVPDESHAGDGQQPPESYPAAPPTAEPAPGPEPLEQPRRLQPRKAQRRASAALRATVALRCGRTYGAGVLLTRDGLVLTANHVVAESDRARAALAGERWQGARVLDRAPDLDLALLKLDAVPAARGAHPPARLGSVLGVRAGDEVLTVGSPRTMHFSLSRGVVSFVGRRFGRMRYLQTDLPVEPGGSGGPVFEEDGRLVALMSFVLKDGQRIAFATPVDYALERFLTHLPRQVSPASFEPFHRWGQGVGEVPPSMQP